MVPSTRIPSAKAQIEPPSSRRELKHCAQGVTDFSGFGSTLATNLSR
jgi:hypothetical protein